MRLGVIHNQMNPTVMMPNRLRQMHDALMNKHMANKRMIIYYIIFFSEAYNVEGGESNKIKLLKWTLR